MSITPEAARAQAEAALDGYENAARVEEWADPLARAVTALLSVFPESPTTDEREAIARASFEATKHDDEPGWDYYAERDHLSSAMDDDFARAERVLALGFRRPSPPTDEPEWEYRWAREDGEHAWPFGPSDEEEGESREAVEAAPLRDPEPEYFDGAHVERRAKAIPAGRWEPVEAAARVGGAA